LGVGHPQRLAVGQVGEIAVRSRFLSPGYWHRPELNKEKFPAHLQAGDKRVCLTGDLGRLQSDNLLEHHGRKDFMVKIRGYRVEISEVEGALVNLHEVKDAVVIAAEDQYGSNKLVAYLVPSQFPPPSTSALRSALTETLPHYMIPSTYIPLDRFPTTTTGKIDRNALPAPGKDRPHLGTPYLPPHTALEKEIEGIWKEVLNLDQIGMEDNFIDLGGHSLLAIQIIARVYETFGVDIPVRILFEAATISSMAAKIKSYQSSIKNVDELTQIIAELEGLSDEDARKMAAGMDS
ncbi:MAG: phosphopantetheine-binding protein, partial [Anaerolineales bacterium]